MYFKGLCYSHSQTKYFWEPPRTVGERAWTTNQGVCYVRSELNKCQTIWIMLFQQNWNKTVIQQRNTKSFSVSKSRHSTPNCVRKETQQTIVIRQVYKRRWAPTCTEIPSCTELSKSSLTPWTRTTMKQQEVQNPQNQYSTASLYVTFSIRCRIHGILKSSPN